MRRNRQLFIGALIGLALAVTALWEPLAEAAHDFNIPPLPYALTYAPGHATLSPHILSARTEGHFLTLTTTLEETIQPGGRIDLILGAQVVELAGQPHLYTPQVIAWRPLQTDDPQQPDFIQVDAVPGVPLKLKTESFVSRMRKVYHYFGRSSEVPEDYSAKEMTASLHRVPLRVGNKPLPAGTPVVWRLGGLPGQAVGMLSAPRQTRVQVAVLVDTQGNGQFRLVKDSPTLEVVGGAAARTRVVAPSVVRPQAPIPVTVQVNDAFDELASNFKGTLRLAVRGTTVQQTLTLKPEDRGQLTVSLPGLGEGTYYLELTGRCEGPCVDSEVHASPAPAAQVEPPGLELRRSVQPVVVRNGGPLLLWGDTHRHSVVADGYAAPAEVYRRALEEEKLDWMCLSEHSHPDPLNAFGVYTKRLLLSPAEWMGLQQLADRFDALPDFTALQGYEWSSNAGHRNVYFHPDETPAPLLSHKTPGGDMPVPEFLETYRDKKVIIIPHHPAWRLHGTPYEWGDRALSDKLQRVVEIYSQHGNSEFFNNPRAIHAGNNIRPNFLPFAKLLIRGRMVGPADQAPEGAPGFVRNILAQGYKLGIIGSSDNHFFDTGPISYSGGLAGIYTGENSRAAVWNGLHDRSAIATSGVRMILELTAGGVGIGQQGPVVKPSGVDEAGHPRLQGRVLGTAALSRVEILRHDSRGYVTVFSGKSDTESLVIEQVDADLQGAGFYYLRVEQADGNLGWAGPIWLEPT